jgi:hypothetical protein
MIMDAPEVKKYSRAGTIWLIVLAAVTMFPTMLMAVIFGIPWLCLVVYIIKRIWRSDDTIKPT